MRRHIFSLLLVIQLSVLPARTFAADSAEANYNSAFQHSDLLSTWIETHIEGFKLGGHRYSHPLERGQTIYSERIFEAGTKALFKENDTFRTYKVTVRLLRPRYKKELEFGFVDDMSQYEPPKLKVESAEPLDVNGIDAKLYYKKDGNCSILIKLSKDAVLNIDGPSCTYVQELIKLAKELDIKRLQDKLNS